MQKLWPYHPEDPTTWPWIGCEVTKLRKGGFHIVRFKNPAFKYPHLIKNYEGKTYAKEQMDSKGSKKIKSTQFEKFLEGKEYSYASKKWYRKNK